MLDKKNSELFQLLMSTRPKSYPIFIETHSLSARRFFYHLAKINDWLKQNDLPEIDTKQTELIIPSQLIEYWKSQQMKTNPIHRKQVHFDERERVLILLLYTFIRTELISNAHYQFLLNVSKNTVTTDVKRANEFSKKFRVKIRYTREQGFHLRGLEEDKRNLMLKCISMFSSHPSKHEIFEYLFRKQGHQDQFAAYEKHLKNVEKAFHLTFIEERMFDFIYLLQMIHIRQHQQKWVQIHSDTNQFLQKHDMYPVALTIQQALNESTQAEELAYLTILLLGITQGQLSPTSTELLTSMTEKIINDFEKYACFQIKNKPKAIEALYHHFKPAYYRMLYKIPITNPLLEEIKEEHASLFSFVSEVMKPIQEMLNIDIPEDEIGFLTIHFGALLEQNALEAKNKKPIRAVIVCSNGISSSLMVETYLHSLFPNFHWLSPMSKDAFSNLDERDYDIVFSTVPLQTSKTLFIVKPIMNEAEKKLLHHTVMQQLFTHSTPYPTPEQIIKIIEKYCVVQHAEKLKEDITAVLYGQPNKTNLRRRQPLLNELITEEMIQFETGISDWKKAIAKAAEPLLQNGYIQPSYIDEMIGNVEKLGPYFIVHPELAIPHARPECGVQKLGMSILKLDEPTYLLNEEKNAVKVLICLAAIDNTTHLKALAQLTKLLGNKESLQALFQAKDKAELLQLIHQYSLT
ncbi:Transcriptional regulator ManR [Anoxybacillus sp. P3H1B]|uniref:BglG family transcription antiterminator n=1 Tax=Anoxybacillus sp. P3H1B TaxID=1769293 RepID=UPI0007965FC5|nr:BglG family transcription antiterminator [Anoxybacillus sp. P3H1B]KXG08934.1 Transcriptional regulator ManR [Anoxybacillus sp. P3H1B]